MYGKAQFVLEQIRSVGNLFGRHKNTIVHVVLQNVSFDFGRIMDFQIMCYGNAFADF